VLVLLFLLALVKADGVPISTQTHACTSKSYPATTRSQIFNQKLQLNPNKMQFNVIQLQPSTRETANQAN
jgi:hypothetical protein